jgi:hypothetical protein
MKTKLYIYLALSVSLVFSLPRANAQILVQFWDFNQFHPVTVTAGDSVGTIFSYINTAASDSTMDTWPLNAAYTAPLSSKGHIIYTRPTKIYGSGGTGKRDSILDEGSGGAFYYDYSSSNYSYFTTSDSGGAIGNGFIRARNPSDSCYLYIYAPTTGYKGISVNYAVSTSSSGAAQYNIISYSTNNGVTWKNLTQAMDTFNIGGVRYPDTLLINNTITATSGWYPVQINFASDTSVNNNANFILRFRPAGSNCSAPSHNDRYDNIAVLATGPSSIDELSSPVGGYTLYPNPASTSTTINGTYNGSKIVTVYNVLGQPVNSIQVEENKQFNINTEELSSGLYFVNIKETRTGNSYILKFVKN